MNMRSFGWELEAWEAEDDRTLRIRLSRPFAVQYPRFLFPLECSTASLSCGTFR